MGSGALYPELGDGEVLVIARVVVVDDPNSIVFGFSGLGVFVFARDAVADEAIELAVGVGFVLGWATIAELF